MKIENETKRLFFGMEVATPWEEEMPKGRVIDAPYRHITLAFLGNVIPKKQLFDPPLPDFIIGPAGVCDRLLFLPDKEARVAAAHIQWLIKEELLVQFHKTLLDWLEDQEYQVDRRELLSHVSLARSPFDKKIWEETFKPLPTYIKAFHLYESVGNLTYPSLWQHVFILPFEELEHTADIAFCIRGATFEELYIHAMLALSFSCPSFIAYFEPQPALSSLEEVVALLNKNVAAMDADIGIPFKAVSYHAKIKKVDTLLEWEMIVDV
ncbi:MAG TPA: hypothetical protein VLF61_00085 [Rhabdochlamydiaceae bacterium]|nr:hypothetical protein [Rhabdochlamydiaceae bacterium]